MSGIVQDGGGLLKILIFASCVNWEWTLLMVLVGGTHEILLIFGGRDQRLCWIANFWERGDNDTSFFSSLISLFKFSIKRKFCSSVSCLTGNNDASSSVSLFLNKKSLLKFCKRLDHFYKIPHSLIFYIIYSLNIALLRADALSNHSLFSSKNI